MQTLFFDCESTGLKTDTDRIIQLAILILDEEGKTLLSKAKYYNPEGTPISKEAQDTHGITEAMLRDAPKFKDDAKALKKLFEGRIIAGYNIMRFDTQILIAEFQRCGIDINFSGKFIDCLNIEKKLNSNKLADAYRRYTGKDIDNAHDALSDIKATAEVFNYQLRELSRISENTQGSPPVEDMIYEFSDTNDLLDLTGKLKKDDQGYVIFNFGKSKGKRVIDDNSYACWILNNPSFSPHIKKIIREEQTRNLTKPQEAPIIPMNTQIILKRKPSGFYQPIETENDELPF